MIWRFIQFGSNTLIGVIHGLIEAKVYRHVQDASYYNLKTLTIGLGST